MKGLDKLRESKDGKDVDEIIEEVVAARRTSNNPKDLFGGPRDWVDAIVPTIAFTMTNVLASLRVAVYVAIGAALLLVLVRVVRRETLRHAFSGVFGVALNAFIAYRTKDADNFFLVGIVTNILYGVGFLLSVVFRRPMVGIIMRLVLERPKEWHQHPLVRRANSEATIAWAAMFLVRFAVQESLRRADMTAALAAVKLAGTPIFFIMLYLTMPYVTWRTRDVPVPESAPEGEAEAGGEDAGDDTPQPVGDSGGA